MTEQLFPKPCTQCGNCCKEEVCIVGEAVLGTSEIPCRALLFDGSRHWCGLVVSPKQFSENPLTDLEAGEVRARLLEMFNFGIGCDSSTIQ